MDELGDRAQMSKGPPATPELIAGVRRCAAANMSYAETAGELSTRKHELTRSAIAGIAKRNGISFGGAPKNQPVKAIPKRRAPSAAYRPAPQLTKRPVPPNLVTMRPAALTKPPGPRCSWAECATYAEPGSMFCFSHGKKGLMT